MRAVLFLLLALATQGPPAGPPLAGAPTPAAPGIRQEGTFVTAPITLDGVTLFRIASPANPQAGGTPVEKRQLAIENALSQLLLITGSGSQRTTLYDPHTIAVRVAPSNDQAVLEATDAKHTKPFPILTATPIDAKYYGMTITSVANNWQKILQPALVNALLKRQPGVQRRNVQQAALVAGLLLLLTLLVWLLVIRPLRRRERAIERRLEKHESELRSETELPTDDTSTGRRRQRFIALTLRAEDPQRQLSVLQNVAGICIWLLVVLWFAGIVWVFFLFPQTTPFARQALNTALSLVAIWITAGLLNRIFDVVIARAARIWRHKQFISSEDRARELLRIPTLTAALSGSKSVLIVFIAFLVSLGELGIPVWSVVTFGGLAAVGITLAAQNFVRDFVNGFLVLAEDQYVVGDYITINAQSGIVENLTMRMAQIRDGGGNLVTIPHSSVTYVVNHSRNWSRVDYRVSIDPSADAGKAMDLVARAIQSIAHDDRWRGVVLDPLEWIGVESLSRDGVIIRASIKTAPLRQYELRRAVNERVRTLFANAGIKFGAPVPDSVP